MRLWHKHLIEVLPSQQLISQWRELCLIASLLAKDHTPNHILVNPILDYEIEHFEKYCHLVFTEMINRTYSVSEKSCKKLEDDIHAYRLYLGLDLPWNWKVDDDDYADPTIDKLYSGWHNKSYLRQCYYNLEEKYDRGGIPENEWNEVAKQYVIFGGSV